MRRTKIVATLGPATDGAAMADAMIEAGLDVVRLNYSHGAADDQARRAQQFREAAGRARSEVGMIADLQGPKIRIGGFRSGPIELEPGEDFVIDADLALNAGDEHHVGITYKQLPQDVKRGDHLLIDDGRLVCQVERVRGNRIYTVVMLGGPLSDSKGVNREGGGLSAPALTRKDKSDLRHAVSIGADYIAVSFARNADDVRNARRLVKRAGGDCRIIAKIERADALANAEAIIEASDGIMVARGDLGVEIGDARLVPEQKGLIKRAREKNRVVITATQMMQSMIDNQIPTRAEVFDVANAVIDGTDAVMLSAETSIGKYPAKTIAAMARICAGTEGHWELRADDYPIDACFERIDQAIAFSAMYAANRIGASAIIALTETGSTCTWMSRMDSDIPIFAFTPHVSTQRKVNLYRGVYPMAFQPTQNDHAELNRDLVMALMERGAVGREDIVIITKGDVFGRTGGTNGMKIVRVAELV